MKNLFQDLAFAFWRRYDDFYSISKKNFKNLVLNVC